MEKSNNVARKGYKIDTFTKYLLLVAVIAVAVLFGFLQPSFFKLDNLLDIIRSASLIGVMGIGLTLVQAAGEFDFGLGAEATIGGVLTAVIMTEASSLPYFVVVLISLLIMVGIGTFNALLVLKVGMPSFITTLGVSTLITGIAKYLTGGGTYFSLGWPPEFTKLGQGFVGGIIPMPAIMLILIAILMWIFLDRTRFGRYIYSAGSNPIASSHVGINVKKQKAVAFILCAVLCGFAGIMQGSMLNSVTPEMGGGNLTLSIGTSMLGATFLRPGVYNVPGAAIGALLLAVISNGLTMIGASFFMKDVIQGGILLIAVGSIALIRKGGLPSVKM